MKPESIILAVAGACFGVIVGWAIGSQQAAHVPRDTAPAATARAAQGEPAQAQAPRAPDEGQVRDLRAVAEKAPGDPQPRVRLGNLYFDAERYDEAAAWYEAALKVAPADADVSTDLGVSYYYLHEPDRALQQFEQSLRIDPTHPKTMLNQGIVKAFGKHDLPGAVAAWKRLIEVAPGSPEAETARRALKELESAHRDLDGGRAGDRTDPSVARRP